MTTGNAQTRADSAQRLWQAAEAVHAVTYFARPVRRAIRAAGAPGFWAGYFGTRLAPLRTTDPVLATSALYVFAAPMVAEHLPDPEDGARWDAARRAAVADVLAGLGGEGRRDPAGPGSGKTAVLGVGDAAHLRDGDGPGRDAWAAAARRVRTLVDACDVRARPLFAAHAGLPWPDVDADPWLAHWHGVTLLREFRGDGHLHVLAGERLSGCEAMVLALRWRDHGTAADESAAADRGWTSDEIADAYAGLAARGWVGDDRALTDAGRQARAAIEAATDARALPTAADERAVAALAATLAPLVALTRPLIPPQPRRHPRHRLMGPSSTDPERRFLHAVLENPRVREILHRAERLDLPDWYLAAGCLFQTVWNVLDGNDPEHGIQDYDLIYHDGTDLSWDAEDVVIRRCAAAFDDLDIDVEVRNQARVHLWYEDHFGVPYPPLRSSADAVDRYAAHACRVAVRSSGGRLEVYAPSGYDDLFAFVVRPNPVNAPRDVYETKSARWAALWPRLQVLPWPDEAADDVNELPSRTG